MTSATTELSGREQLDRIGAVASGLCAAHCAVCALLPAAFGALGLGLLLGHEAELVLTLVAVMVAAGALILGWRRHRSVPVAGLLMLGIAGLLASRGLEMGSVHHERDSHPHAGEGHSAAPPGGAAFELAALGAELAGDQEALGVAEHEGLAHRAGPAVGVLGGLSLLFGHILNIRVSGRCRKGSCG